MQKKNTTIYDVAKECDVSVATVSRVINGKDNVKSQTKKNILNKIKELNFQPNAVARSLFKKETGMIGVILPDITNPFFSQIFIEIEKAALNEGYTTFLCNSINNYENESLYLKSLSEKQVEAIVIIGGRINNSNSKEKDINEINEILTHTPIIMINGSMENVDCYKIITDERKGIFDIVNYFCELDHKYIAILGGKKGVTSTEIKVSAFKEALKKNGLTYYEQWNIYSGFSYESGKTAMSELLKNEKLPTAILCINDLVALGCIKYCEEKNVKIPNEFSITGFDDIYLTEIVSPNLTTVNQNYSDIGKTVISTIKNIQGGDGNTNKTISIDTKLVKRSSCILNKYF